MEKPEPTGFPRGVVTPLVTMLKDDQSIDTPAMTRLVGRQVEAGVDALFVLGSVGEGPMLGRGARRQVVECAVTAADGRVPVYAGVSENSTAQVVRAARECAGMGAAAAVATLPYYGWSGDQEHARDFFRAVADESPIPLIVYNLPKVARVSLDLGTMLALAGHPRIVGLKDTRDDFEGMRAMAACPERRGRMTYLVGNTTLAGRLLQAGADGVVSTLANLFPRLVVDAFRAFTTKGASGGEAYQRMLEKAGRLLHMPTAPAAIKYGLGLQGIGQGATVHPWPAVGEEQQRAIEALIGEIEAELGAPDPLAR